MLIALGCVTVLALSSLATLGYVLACQREERAQTAVERRELLERIQRPERPVVTAAREFTLPDREEAIAAQQAWMEAGTVASIADHYGLTGDDG